MDEKYRQIARASLWSELRLAYGLIPFVTVLRRHEIDVDALLAAADIPRFGLVDPGYRISIDQEVHFLRVAIAALQVPGASLEVASQYGLRGFSVLGLAMQASENPLAILQLVMAYPRLAWGMFDAVLWASEEEMRIRFEPQARLGSAEAFLTERDLGCGLMLIREACETDFRPLEVSFRHARQGPMDSYEAFFGCKVSFHARHTEMRCRIDDILQPLPHADRMAREFYEAQCARMSASMDVPFSYSTTIRERLMRARPIPSLTTLAAQLHMTPRTLQRRLTSENVRFSALLRDVRLQRAQQLITEQDWRLEQIATELGFTDAVAFSHAFKSWTGESPGRWRRLQNRQA